MRKSTISRLGLALLCTLALGLLMAGIARAEITGVTGDGFSYGKWGDAAIITGYEGTETFLYIPEQVEGVAVKKIGEQAFWKETSLVGVLIPDSIASIGDQAFLGCSGLKSLNIPNGVNYIGAQAFYGCGELASLVIPGGITSIEYGTFYGCGRLTSLAIPSGVTSIGKEAFAFCAGLTSLSIPDGVTSIPDRAFIGCGGISSLVIPSGVTSIGSQAFSACGGLINLSIPGSVVSIGSHAFDGCSELISVDIHNGVKSIGDSMFSHCNGLTSLSIPNSVTSIGSWAFDSCSGLTSLSIPSSVISIGDRAFGNCSSLTSLNIPNSVTSIGAQAFYYCYSLTSVNLPSGITSIGAHTFSNCKKLLSMTIPSSVINIGADAFYYCLSLTSVTIPSSVASIGERAFSYCQSLTSVTLPNSVTSIGAYAFSRCIRLISIIIPKTVSVIGENAFLHSPVTIRGSVGSYAQTYADEISIPFAPIDGPKITNITFEPNNIEIDIYVSAPQLLTPVILPNDASFKTLVWVSSDTDIAVVGRDGMVGAYSLGTVTITATAQDGSEVSASCTVTVVQKVTYLALDLASDTLDTGKTQQLTAIIHPANASNKGLAWASIDPAIATVDAKGLVTAVAPGTTTITATAQDGSAVYTACNITVLQKATGITLDLASATLDTGKTQQLTATILPANASNKGVVWTSSDPAIAMVDANGLVSAVAPDTAIITATAQDGSGMSATCTVTVVQKVTAINCYPASAMLDTGRTQQLTATVLPENASNKGLDWTSSDPTIATVDATGLVTAVAPGSATITATANDGSGMTAACTVTVQAPVAEDLRGDANNDGAVDILDLVSIIDYIVSNTSPASPANADANGDGTVDILDLVWIIDQIVGG